MNTRRDYPRLKALVMANRSAELLDLSELLRLAEDPMCPESAGAAYDWAERFAIPVISELRRRLESSAKQVDDKPTLMRLLREMRKAHRGKDKASREALEAEVDAIIGGDLQPSLFAEVAS